MFLAVYDFAEFIFGVYIEKILIYIPKKSKKRVIKKRMGPISKNSHARYHFFIFSVP